VGSSASSVWLADFNGDGHLDILAVTFPKLQILFGDGKGGFGAPVAILQSGIPAIGPTVVADFNGDGLADIAFAFNSGDPTLAVLFGGGHGAFSLSPQPKLTVGTPSGFSHITVTATSGTSLSTALDITVTP
jgi:hypothetical protein